LFSLWHIRRNWLFLLIIGDGFVPRHDGKKINIMTNKKTIISFTTTFLFASIFLIACSNDSENDEHQHENAKVDENTEHDHASHSDDDGSDHMAHMNEVRNALKKELGDQYNAIVPDATEEQIALGAEIFKNNCISCHGEQGKGNGPAAVGLPTPPADFTDGAHATFYSEEGRRQIIRKGIAGTVMIAWENTLSDKEIDVVYAFIKNFIKPVNTEIKSDDGHNHEH